MWKPHNYAIQTVYRLNDETSFEVGVVTPERKILLYKSFVTPEMPAFKVGALSREATSVYEKIVSGSFSTTMDTTYFEVAGQVLIIRPAVLQFDPDEFVLID